MNAARRATIQATAGAVLLVVALIGLGLALTGAAPSGHRQVPPTTTTCCTGRCS